MVFGEDSQNEHSLSSLSGDKQELAETIVGSSGKDTAREQEGCVPVTVKKIGRYQIEWVLGIGAMGAVYLARDETLDRLVAIKIPKFPRGSGDEVIQRFYREARSAAAITHPNICAIYDVGEDDGTHYIAMQYVEGHSLADYVNSYRQPQEQVAIVVRKIALAMHEAHRYQLVHRDLKPDNVMIDHRGEPVVMDFGLARRSDQEDVRITREGAISGSPAYMSPEQLEGKVADVDPRSDIYSLGVLFYEGLTGTLPFKGGGSIVALITEVISKQPTDPREVRKDLDPRICAICMRAMARNPHERFASMQEMAVALDHFLNVYSAVPRAQIEIKDDADIPLDLEVGLDESREDPLPPGSSFDLVREKCRKVRDYLEQKEFEKAVSLLKQIANEKDLRFAKYAEWAATELPRIRGVVAANQDAALSATDVPVLAPLEEDILWESSSDDLSASAQLRPRERSTAGTKKQRRTLLLIGAVIALFGVIGILTLVLVS